MLASAGLRGEQLSKSDGSRKQKIKRIFDQRSRQAGVRPGRGQDSAGKTV